MSDQRGGDSERIAPIIPLFGGPARAERPADGGADDSSSAPPARSGPPADAARLWRSTWHEPSSAGSPSVDDGSPSARHPARGAAARAASRGGKTTTLRAVGDTSRSTGGGEGAENGPSAAEIRVTAEESLVRKLRTRSLSVSEARLVLRGHGLATDAIEDVIDDFVRRGYLDDAVLAELLVTSGVERKGQGRVALSRALAQRGIPREVIDAALDELPDDDAERALEFARTKARSMGRLDPDAALRRLVGQLSRRGYGGSVAMNAAKTALREASFGGGVSGVRFVDSD